MFEKEAEEYAEENQIYVSEYCSYNHLVKAYQKGAGFGYKKAKDEAIEIIEKLLKEEKNNMYWEMNGSDKSSYYEVRKQAEQFLEESK